MHKLSFATLSLFTPFLMAQGSPEVEPNNLSTDTGVYTLGLGTQGQGAVDVSGDVDLFKITLTGASDLRIWTNPGFTGAVSDTLVDLIAADGTTVLATDDDSGAGLYSLLVSGNLAAGDYYVRVRGYSTNVGAYTFDVVAAAPGTYVSVTPPLSGVTEGAENNDPRPAFGSGVATPSAVFTTNSGFTAAPVSPATSGSSSTTTGKDYDFYEFNAAVAGSYVFRTTGSGAAPAPVINDTVIHLFSGAFALLATNDDFSGAYSQITFNIVTPGTYYISVTGYYGSTSATPSTGNYLLDILGPLPAPPTGTATVTAQVGGCSGATLGIRAPGSEVPVLGSAFYLDAAGLDPFTPAFRVLGLTSGPAFDLGAVGGPAGCLVDVAPLDTTFVLADANGNDFWLIGTPVDVAFIGLTLEQQMVALDSVDVIVATNRVSSVCGIKN